MSETYTDQEVSRLVSLARLSKLSDAAKLSTAESLTGSARSVAFVVIGASPYDTLTQSERDFYARLMKWRPPCR